MKLQQIQFNNELLVDYMTSPTKLRIFKSQTKKIQSQKYNLANGNGIDPILRAIYRQKLSTLIAIQETKNNQKKIYVAKGNNHPIVIKQFVELGYNPVISRQYADVIWLLEIPQKCQLVNFIPFHQSLTNKEKMYRNIIQYNEGKTASGKSYIPQTFIIDLKNQPQKHLKSFLERYFSGMPNRNKLLKLQQKGAVFQVSNTNGTIFIPFKKVHPLKLPAQNNKLWIFKPTTLNRGRGISLFSTIKQLKELLTQDSLEISVKMYSDQPTQSTFIIQYYIQRPLLIQGYKFDIRMWMLIVMDKKTKKTKTYMYQHGYVRLAGIKYQEIKTIPNNQTLQQVQLEENSKIAKSGKDSKHINNRFMHLTNNAVQKNSKNYGLVYQGNQMSLNDMEQYFKGKIRLQNLLDEFRMIMVDTVNSVKHIISQPKSKKHSKRQHFQLFGYDFLLDSTFSPWLLEINCNPCLQQSSTLLKKIIPEMLLSLIKILNFKYQCFDKQYDQTINYKSNSNYNSKIHQKTENQAKNPEKQSQTTILNHWSRII